MSATPAPRQDDITQDKLAQAAVVDIRDGMMVGLGTGRAASRGIRALAQRVQAESIEVTCVATSRRSSDLATELGLTVVPMSEVAHVDVLFDGVDELEPGLAMTKGAGGAMTWEKIVAEAADLRVYLMDESKIVARLGERFPLPVEVIEFARGTASARLETLGLQVAVREGEDGRPYRTDENNLVLDCVYGDTSRGDLNALATSIDRIPGVIGHGLFVNHADRVLIESADRSRLETRVRP